MDTTGFFAGDFRQYLPEVPRGLWKYIGTAGLISSDLFMCFRGPIVNKKQGAHSACWKTCCRQKGSGFFTLCYRLESKQRLEANKENSTLVLYRAWGLRKCTYDHFLQWNWDEIYKHTLKLMSKASFRTKIGVQELHGKFRYEISEPYSQFLHPDSVENDDENVFWYHVQFSGWIKWKDCTYGLLCAHNNRLSIMHFRYIILFGPIVMAQGTLCRKGEQTYCFCSFLKYQMLNPSWAYQERCVSTRMQKLLFKS